MNWMKFYYANPRLDHLVDDVARSAEQGLLDDMGRRVILGTFLGRVFAAHPDRVAGWLDQLSARLTDPGARNTVQLAAYFSNTPEAFVWLVQTNEGDLSKMQASPDLLVAPIEEGLTLDSLWAYYFATGDARAVRRVVSAFNYLPDAGAAKRYDESADKSEADEKAATRDRLYTAAAWSLAALMREHPPLLNLCEWMLNGPDLTPDERLSLGLALEKAAPETWSVEIKPDEDRARIRKRVGGREVEVAKPRTEN
ncbi:MAG TPA: hypothetical protein VGC42_07070 [Kofleriaceae bacterium]